MREAGEAGEAGEGSWVCVGGVKSCSEIILAPTYTFDHTTSIHVSLSALSAASSRGFDHRGHYSA